ncbi:MAG: hypothetical protein R2752_07265 [Vicinamibacterales bacterium]
MCIGRPLTRASLAAYAPATAGVYGVFSGQRWIYFGASADVHHALLAHLADPTHCMHAFPDLRYSVEATDERAERLKALLEEFPTPCNTPTPAPGPNTWRPIEADRNR